MNKVCLINLAGIPAAGKTTFCRQFCEYLHDNKDPFNVVHIEFDQFVRIPMGEERLQYFGSKMFKQNRFRLRWIIRELIDDIKVNRSIEKSLKLFHIDYPECTLRTVLQSNIGNFIILIDDNMYYKSMRKEIRSIAKEKSTGYLILHLEISVAEAISRNKSRTEEKRLAHDIITHMASKFERPEQSEGSIVRFNMEGYSQFQVIIDAIQQCIQHPLSPEPIAMNTVVEQSQLHRLDLILRKEISQKMKNSDTNRRILAEIYCQKRKLILNDLRRGLLNIPDNLMELKDMLF